ncbi:MAG: hypothetical protein U0931_04185 [Vulcanimicrobiota bacterium]
MLTGIRPEQVARVLIKKPEPAPAPVVEARSPAPAWFNFENGLKLLALGTRLGVQVGAVYYQRQRYWASRQQLVLEAASHHHGWLTRGDVLKALEYRHAELERVMDALCTRKVCRRVLSRSGEPLYLFDSLLPAVHFCDYCDQERPHGPLRSCSCCGAP